MDEIGFTGDKNDSKLNSKMVRHFSETMWYCGKVVGKVSGYVGVKDLPFLKQMLCGVHTEEGFCVLRSNVLRNEYSSNLGFCSRYGKLPDEVIFPYKIFFRLSI